MGGQHRSEGRHRSEQLIRWYRRAGLALLVIALGFGGPPLCAAQEQPAAKAVLGANSAETEKTWMDSCRRVFRHLSGEADEQGVVFRFLDPGTATPSARQAGRRWRRAYQPQ